MTLLQKLEVTHVKDLFYMRYFASSLLRLVVRFKQPYRYLDKNHSLYLYFYKREYVVVVRWYILPP
jgi:hypothetical protein